MSRYVSSIIVKLEELTRLTDKSDYSPKAVLSILVNGPDSTSIFVSRVMLFEFC